MISFMSLLPNKDFCPPDKDEIDFMGTVVLLKVAWMSRPKLSKP